MATTIQHPTSLARPLFHHSTDQSFGAEGEKFSGQNGKTVNPQLTFLSITKYDEIPRINLDAAFGLVRRSPKKRLLCGSRGQQMGEWGMFCPGDF